MNNKKGFLERILSVEFLLKLIPIGISALGILFILLVYGFDLEIGYYTYNSIWSAADVTTNSGGVHICCTALIILFIVNILLFILEITQIIRKKASGFYIMIFSSLSLKIANLVLQIGFDIANGLGVFLLIFGLLLDIGSMVCIFICQKKYTLFAVNNEENIETNNQNVNVKKHLIISIISLIIFLTVFIIPLYSGTKNNQSYTFMLLSALSKDVDVIVQVAFIIVFLSFIALVLYFIHSISYYQKYQNEYAKKTQNIVYASFVLTLVYFLIGYFICIIEGTKNNDAKTISFIPFIIMMGVLIAHSIIKGKSNFILEVNLSNKNKNKFEPLIYLIIVSVLSFMTLFVNVLKIEFEFLGRKNNASYTGLELLTNSTINGGYQMLAFVVFLILITSAVLLVLSISAYFSKNNSYYKITSISTFTNVLLLFFIGIFGMYYSIAQKINEENILLLLEESGYGGITLDYVTKITTQTLYLFFAGLAVLIAAIARKQIGNHLPVSNNLDNSLKLEQSSTKQSGSLDNTVFSNFDACPAFTELDNKKKEFDLEYNKKLESLYSNPTLPALVKFVVDYARESRLHLSYTHEDIANFVAGLGASRLTILQGMSGTGKTSLPKIFCEAILGNCEVIEVESSWRDKNELLGYYNEFSKSYSPKKFTQKLYKAKLNPDVVTMIVLDEMNLSRIEYYFSDFLSLMEHEEHNREIKLLNIKLNRYENNVKYDYLALTDGHTIKIPTNVWFIGTANRDESTFEISDKVYDRAQTMNFNKRAPKVRSYTEPIPQKFLKYSDLSKLLNDAIKYGNFEAEDNLIIKGVEKILQPFNISFGNRILKQIEEFVKIYCACFNDGASVLNEAVEKIILSKVVSKLEFKNVENKDKLISEFNKLGLSLCSEFVRKLNED